MDHPLKDYSQSELIRFDRAARMRMPEVSERDFKIKDELEQTHGIWILPEDVAIFLEPPKGQEEPAAMVRVGGILHSFKELIHREGFLAVHEVRFNDLSLAQMRRAYPGTLRKEDADQIVSFLRSLSGVARDMVFHCQLGVSRSAAVAIVWARIKGDAEAERLIRDCRFFVPNEGVEEILLAALGRVK